MNTITRIVAEDFVTGRALKMAMGHAAVVFRFSEGALAATMEYNMDGDPADTEIEAPEIVIDIERE